jgi:hypothetical protein
MGGGAKRKVGIILETAVGCGFGIDGGVIEMEEMYSRLFRHCESLYARGDPDGGSGCVGVSDD